MICTTKAVRSVSKQDSKPFKGQVVKQTTVKWSIIKVADKGSKTVVMDIPLPSSAKQEREMT